MCAALFPLKPLSLYIIPERRNTSLQYRGSLSQRGLSAFLHSSILRPKPSVIVSANHRRPTNRDAPTYILQSAPVLPPLCSQATGLVDNPFSFQAAAALLILRHDVVSRSGRCSGLIGLEQRQRLQIQYACSLELDFEHLSAQFCR